MWKVVIADDEGVILQGLKKLIDWQSIDVALVGEARDGQRLKEVIEETQPDIVIADIMMPHMTGLEVIRWYAGQGSHAKFIFISGYQEFSYAREAIKCGAVDYLLKPVGRKELEDAVQKAIQRLVEQNTVEIFKREDDEMQKLFREINDGQEFENEELYQLFAAENMELQGHFFAGICIGIQPDKAAEMMQDSFERFNLLRFSVYNQIAQQFRGRGFVLRKDDCAIHMMGVFPYGEEQVFVSKYVLPVIEKVEKQMNVPLTVGIGMISQDVIGLKNVYKTAKFAFELYYFEEMPIIDIKDIHKDYHVSFEDYSKSVDNAFRALIGHDEDYQTKIEAVMNTIEAIHYGNRNAASARVLYFTGDVTSKLFSYNLLDGDFYAIQDALQKETEKQKTFRALRDSVTDYFVRIWQNLEKNVKSKDKMLIEDVKKYIQKHYMEDLSVKELAEVACVSQNYFSAMFKKETGQNYKAYLTEIRMEAAIKLLLQTDDKTYEIGEKVGYNNVRRFVEAFKHIYKVSPMEYKKQLKGE